MARSAAAACDPCADAHDAEVRRCIGSALRRAVAVGLEMPGASIGELETACGFLTDGGTRPSGVIRAWTKGRLPKAMTIKNTRVSTGGRVDLAPVLAEPLFELACWGAPEKRRLKAILRSLPAAVRREIYFDEGSDTGLVIAPGFRPYQQLRDQGSLDALIALLALARRSEDADDQSDHFAPARAAFDLWPRVVATTWVRDTDWTLLTKCLHRVLWDRVYSGGLMPGTRLDTLLENVSKTIADPAADLPLSAGPTRSEVDELLGRTGVLWLELARIGDEKGRVAVRQAARDLASALNWLRRARADERRRAGRSLATAGAGATARTDAFDD